MKHHWDTIGVLRLDSLFKQLAFLLQVPRFLNIVLQLFHLVPQVTELIQAVLFLFIVFKNESLVLSEESNLVLKIFDLLNQLLLGSNEFIPHFLNLTIPFPKEELHVVELLFNYHLFISDFVDLRFKSALLNVEISLHVKLFILKFLYV